uniref:Stress response protein nst1-like n=1 Tax=Nelumbo nucifera TaxID=4432 RepID=A0A822Z5C2_NELNU|nr:TPA_asm: hypothetical protein HUJ06_012977 [Nelumbo nucifera]
MCILCVVQKWSRRVATMLPWLVIPLIGLWALSQLLPPGFRFEVTSPRLACVLVLLVTLFWYEVLMPQLSAWRARRNARLRERKRFEAIEMQKLRKTATRRCRNCSTPYRDQNPGGGKFMCSYCGHISKRPVLDLPGPAGLGIDNSGIGKIWNGKLWSENGWICGQDWLDSGSWVGGSFPGKSSHWEKNGGAIFGSDDRCLAERSYCGVFVCACKLLASLILSIRWIWRKIFRVSTERGDASLDAEHKDMLSKKGENGVNCHESRGEKARRKAEEKRQARLERELLEEEERKQREEVARLVEERRRLRDEKMEAEKERGKGSSPVREKDSKREAERKRQERRREKDKVSSKSNSDGEELERKAGKDNEKKRDSDKRSELERRDFQKVINEGLRVQSSEVGHGVKVTTANNFIRGSTGSRYLDHVKGSFLNSSKAFNGASFFGKGTHPSATVICKSNKFSNSVEQVQTSGNRREVHLTERTSGKLTFNGDDKTNEGSLQRPVALHHQQTTPKKSWQQLFSRSSATPSSSANTISRHNHKPQADNENLLLPGQASPSHPLGSPIHFGMSSPFTIVSFPNVLASNGSVSSAAETIFPLVGESTHESIAEEPELFEDPCYVPDPESLLGPVSESLDNFPLDIGGGFITGLGLEKPRTLQDASVEVHRPSPIESPISRLRVAEEKHASLPCTPKIGDLHPSSLESSNTHEQGTWQMWGTSPLGQDGLGLVGGPVNWLLPLGQNKSNQEDAAHPLPYKTMPSQIMKENQILPGTPQKVCFENCQNGGMFKPFGPASNDSDPWLQKSVFQPLLGNGDNQFPPLNAREDVSQSEKTYGGPSISAANHPFELSAANCWSNPLIHHFSPSQT